MKISTRIVVMTIGFVMALSITAQTTRYKNTGGISWIKNEYFGDMGNGLWSFCGRSYSGVGLSFSRYVNPTLNLGIESSYGDYGFRKNPTTRFIMRKFDMLVMGDYKPFNLGNMQYDNPLTPILTAGLGFASYDENFKPVEYRYTSFPGTADLRQGIDLLLAAGAGLKYQLTERFALQYKYVFYLTNRDIRDENLGSDSPVYKKQWGNDSFGKHQFSLIFAIGQPTHAWRRY